MAGYRLAPKAARARRNPWQRRRRALTASTAQTLSVGTATEVDSAPVVVPLFNQSVAVGTAGESDSALVITAAGTGTTAQGGLAFLFSRAGGLTQTIPVGTATETDTALSAGPAATQTISVGTAGETDTARPIASPFTQSVGVGTALEVDVAPAVGAASGLFVVHPQGMVPGTSIGAYRRWEWRGPVAAKLNAGPGAAVQTATVAADLTASFTLPPGEYVAYSPAYPTKRLFFMVTE